MIKQGKLSLEKILRNYTEIDRQRANGKQYIMFEHNTFGEDEVIVVDLDRKCYCDTLETLAYTIENEYDEFEWYALSK